MTTNFYDHDTKTLNTTALQLAAIGFLYDYTYDTLSDMKDYLSLVVFDAALKPYFLRNKLYVEPRDVVAILNDLADVIDKKSLELGVSIYDPCPQVMAADGSSKPNAPSKKSLGLCRPMHRIKHIRNTNLVLNEVARDLCLSVTVQRFRVMYDDEDIHRRYPCSFDTIIEIMACGKGYTASMFNEHFFPVYSLVPYHLRQHFLLGRNDEGYDVTDPTDGFFPPIDTDANNPLVIKTLERICVSEQSKCIDHHIYTDALKNPLMVKHAQALAEFLGISFPAALVFISKAQREGEFDSTAKDDRRALLNVEFTHLIEKDEDIDYLMELLSGMDNGDGFESDYAVAPIFW